MLKHSTECLMMNADRNEEQQRRPIDNHICMIAYNRIKYLTRIARICCLIPRQTEMKHLGIRLVCNCVINFNLWKEILRTQILLADKNALYLSLLELRGNRLR